MIDHSKRGDPLVYVNDFEVAVDREVVLLSMGSRVPGRKHETEMVGPVVKVVLTGPGMRALHWMLAQAIRKQDAFEQAVGNGGRVVLVPFNGSQEDDPEEP